MMQGSKRIAFVAAVLGALILSDSAAAQTIGSPEAGRRFAEAWCSECHVIGPKVVAGDRRGPDFIAIAQRPSTTELALKVFLRSNHENMPNFIVPPADAEDIVAYILSLKGR